MSRSLFVRTIPMPSRKDIIELYQQGLSTAEISNQLQVSRAWARRVWQDFRDHGTVRHATTRRRTPKWERWAEQIRAAVERQPDITHDELEVELQTGLARSTLCRALQKLKLMRKKDVSRLRAGTPG